VVDHAAVFAAFPTACLLIDPDLVVVDANPAHGAFTGRRRDEVVGRRWEEAFPDPGDPSSATSRELLRSSVRRAFESGATDRLPLLRYDVAAGDGGSEERWWSVVDVPVRGPDGEVSHVLTAVEDVTAAFVTETEGQRAIALADDLRTRAEGLEADLLERARQVQALSAAEAVAARRLAGLADAALAVAGAESVDDLVDIVIVRGLGALGADAGAIAVRDDERGVLRVTTTPSFGGLGERTLAELPLDDPLPGSVAAATGQRVLLGDREAAMAWSPAMARLHAIAAQQAWAALPLQVQGRLLGSLSIGWDAPQRFPADEVALLGAFAAQCSQALERIQQRQLERESATATRRLAEALQRSLLTEPPQPDHLEIAVRYLPAAQEAQVGGDWYDAFLLPDGATVLVVGDVSGHDRDAAAAMAQLRNVLRGVAHSLGDPPAALLTGLDRAMEGLAVGALATAVLGRLEQTGASAERGERVLRWSNAGHLPPLLLAADGTASLLEHEPDLLLGLDPETPRADHAQLLEAGSTVLLYTDGLVERRGASLAQGLEWLRCTAEELAGGSLQQLCDGLLADLSGTLEDDVALLAVRAHPEDRPRPEEAGAQVLAPGRQAA
jgi:PAS domain S-box-containing protein